jgi:hypothetical protein
LHRLLPLQEGPIACAARRHPKMVEWLAANLGARPAFVAELPRKLELAARHSGMDLDPERLLIDALSDHGLLRPEDVARARAIRTLITDPISKWLRLQNLVTEARLNETFREICYLPRATPWRAEEVRRLATVLPPGFAEEHGCYCLEESQAAVRLGLAQLPAAATVHQLYDRLVGCSILFEALTLEQAQELRSL